MNEYLLNKDISYSLVKHIEENYIPQLIHDYSNKILTTQVNNYVNILFEYSNKKNKFPFIDVITQFYGINYRFGSKQQTLLLLCIKYNLLKEVLYLLSQGANSNEADIYGHMAHYYAKRYCPVLCDTILKEGGINK